MSDPLPRRLCAEVLGTAFLLATVIGSGVMGERLSGGNAEICAPVIEQFNAACCVPKERANA